MNLARRARSRAWKGPHAATATSTSRRSAPWLCGHPECLQRLHAAGACLVFRGIERAIPLLHGSQGCSTYIRRYLIGHFREPVDIASSNFSESSAVHGGRQILHQGLENVIRQYAPELIGIASTCLSETIGDDISLYVKEFRRDRPDRVLPELVHVSTPSYRDTHAEGFHAAVRAVVETLAQSGPPERLVNLLPGMVSPADLRYLKEVAADFD